MRMLVQFQCPLEPFSTLIRNGTAGQAIQKAMDAIKPEAAYFTATEGKRGGILVVDVPDASKIPAIAEPLFLTFNATVMFYPCMTPDDLARANLEALGQTYR